MMVPMAMATTGQYPWNVYGIATMGQWLLSADIRDPNLGGDGSSGSTKPKTLMMKLDKDKIAIYSEEEETEIIALIHAFLSAVSNRNMSKTF